MAYLPQRTNNPRPRTYFTHVPTGDIYRLEASGFTKCSGTKRCILRNLTDGKYWDIAWKDLSQTKIIKGSPQEVWQKMPEGWHPEAHHELRREVPYPGYTNDPREVSQNVYNVARQELRHTPAYYGSERYNKDER